MVGNIPTFSNKNPKKHHPDSIATHASQHENLLRRNMPGHKSQDTHSVFQIFLEGYY